MNSLILTVNLVNDPTVRTGSNGVQYVTGRVAHNPGGQNNTAMFLSYSAFGSTADFLQKYCHKGTRLNMRGRLRSADYINQQTGQKVTTYSFTVEEVEFANTRSSEQSQNQGQVQQSQPAQQNTGYQQNQNSQQNVPMPPNFGQQGQQTQHQQNTGYQQNQNTNYQQNTQQKNLFNNNMNGFKQVQNNNQSSGSELVDFDLSDLEVDDLPFN